MAIDRILVVVYNALIKERKGGDVYECSRSEQDCYCRLIARPARVPSRGAPKIKKGPLPYVEHGCPMSLISEMRKKH